MSHGLVFTVKHPKAQYEADRIVAEANDLGNTADKIFYEDLKIGFENGKKWQLWLKEQNFEFVADWVYLRSTHYGGYGGATDLRWLMLKKMQSQGVKILNGYSLVAWPRMSKSVQYGLFTEAGVPVIPSWHGSEIGNTDIGDNYPKIVKKTLSSMGMNVYKVESWNEIEEIGKKEGWGQLLIQDYIKIQEDYRVMVVGGEAIGVIKRIAPQGAYLTNVSAGGMAEKAELTEELKQIAEKAAKACGLEHAGVDILYSAENIPMVLEVNRHPQFQGFEKATGINVARKIVEYLMEKRKE